MKPDRTAAVTALLDLEGPRVHALARRMCGNPQDAEDLVQETFLNAIRAWDQLQDPENPRPWLYSIARRSCQRMRRRRAGEPAHLESYDALVPRPSETGPELPSTEHGPHADRLRAEAREIVERALSTLPDTFRLPLVLADVAELDTAEIAAVLGLKEATVKTRIHRARLKLRDSVARGLPQRALAAPGHARRICLDLLGAKLEALDRRLPFDFSDAALCDRCRTVFDTLDLARGACAAFAADRIPAKLRKRILHTAAA
jgi:RNA polymerase sigma-70 factor (ECF subfamily)